MDAQYGFSANTDNYLLLITLAMKIIGSKENNYLRSLYEKSQGGTEDFG